MTLQNFQHNKPLGESSQSDFQKYRANCFSIKQLHLWAQGKTKVPNIKFPLWLALILEAREMNKRKSKVTVIFKLSVFLFKSALQYTSF